MSLELGSENSSHGGPASMDKSQIKGKKGDKRNKGKQGKGKGEKQNSKYNNFLKSGKNNCSNGSGKDQGSNKGRGYNNQSYGGRFDGKQGTGKSCGNYADDDDDWTFVDQVILGHLGASQ